MKRTTKPQKFYAVIDLDSPWLGPMKFCDGGIEEHSLALWHGDGGTLFTTYEQTRSAIRTSRRYAKREQLPWTFNMKIVPLYVDGERKERGR